MVHHSLVRGWRSVQSEWQYVEFVMAMQSGERCFRLIVGVDWYLPIPFRGIHFTEEPRVSGCFEDFVDLWQWIVVVWGDGVQASIIHTDPIGSVLFLDHNNRRGPWGGGRFDDSRLEHLVNFFLDGFPMTVGQRPSRIPDGECVSGGDSVLDEIGFSQVFCF